MELNQRNHTAIMKELIPKLCACSAVPLSCPILSYYLSLFPLFLPTSLYEFWCSFSTTAVLFVSLIYQKIACTFCRTYYLHWFSKLSEEQKQVSQQCSRGSSEKLHCNCVKQPHQQHLELPYTISNTTA